MSARKAVEKEPSEAGVPAGSGDFPRAHEEAASGVPSEPSGEAGSKAVQEEERSSAVQAQSPEAELVPYDDPFRAMDAADEAQILDELQGRPSEVMVYSFAQKGGKLVSGLSYAGVAEVVRTMNDAGHTAIRVSQEFRPTIEEYQEEDENGELVSYFRVIVYAEDSKNGGGQYGMATQRKFQTFKDKRRKPELDHFALTKALSKAMRNAMLPLTPLVYRETLIAQLLKDDRRVKRLRAGEGSGRLAELPPPLEGPEADERRARCRELYVQIKDLRPGGIGVLLPAEFHQYLTRAEHSLERLDDFIDYLEQRLAEAKEKAA